MELTLAELYEISDGLAERRKRMLAMQANPLHNGLTLERMLKSSASAHDKVTAEIINRISTI